MTGDRRERRDRLAARLALAGAVLGVTVGLVDVVIGASIRGWVGGKLDTAILGAGTMALSAIAVLAALAWQRPGGSIGGRRLATMLALALPGAVCFTTIGRLWYVPGPLLLGAVVLIFTTSTREELLSAVTRKRWLGGLTVALGAYYVFLGFDSLAAVGALGIIGGLLVCSAVAIAHRRRRMALVALGLGAMPFAIATWWSVVTPLIALLMLTIGTSAIGKHAPRRGPRDRQDVRSDRLLGSGVPT